MFVCPLTCHVSSYPGFIEGDSESHEDNSLVQPSLPVIKAETADGRIQILKADWLSELAQKLS